MINTYRCIFGLFYNYIKHFKAIILTKITENNSIWPLLLIFISVLTNIKLYSEIKNNLY
jgi:hypothetical protein